MKKNNGIAFTAEHLTVRVVKTVDVESFCSSETCWAVSVEENNAKRFLALDLKGRIPYRLEQSEAKAKAWSEKFVRKQLSQPSLTPEWSEWSA